MAKSSVEQVNTTCPKKHMSLPHRPSGPLGNRTLRGTILAAILLTLTYSTGAQSNITTYQYNNQRSGVNGSETILTPSNVNTTDFGELFSQPVDGYVYAQPLYMANQTINGATHNVVYIATEHDSVYAFDADSNAGANAQPLWHTNFLSSGVTTIPSSDLPSGNGDIIPEIGITGTPVIDPMTNTLFVVADTLENNGTTAVQRLHALDITTGAEKPGSPIVISASVTVPGQSAVVFTALGENQRAGLLFYNGVVYIGFSAHGDGTSSIRGWILGYSYNGSNFSQTFVFCTEPSSANGWGGGIWMGGQGLMMDTGSNLFVAVGNGQFDTTLTPPINYGDSILRIDLSQGPTVQDYFTPSNQLTMAQTDGDLGSGGMALLPTQSGAHPDLLVQAGKAGTIYVVNRDNMGQFNSSGDSIVQELGSAIQANFAAPVYFNGKVYFCAEGDFLRAYTVTNGTLSTSATDLTTNIFGFPGATPTISASGTSNAVLWVVDEHAYSKTGPSGPAVLWAYNPNQLSTFLYNSNQNLSQDNPGGAVKYAVPIVNNGKVYVGAEGQLSVYGELSSASQVATPAISPASETFTSSLSVSITDTTPGATIYYTTDGSTPPGSPTSQVYTAPFVVSTTTTVNAAGSESGYTNSLIASATYTLQGVPTVSTVSPTSGAAGTAVTITGTNFGSTQGASTVTFNGTAATPTSWSATSIATTVPATATTGNVVVTVGGVASNGVSFTVTSSSGSGPSITTLNPVSGLVGTAVTITGANFGSTQSTSTITFNGTAATATSWSATGIATTVPAGATTGNVVVTVGGVASNGVSFTVSSACGETSQSGTDWQNADWAFATPCVTGSNANGYTVASIQYWVGNPASTSFDLGIYADSSSSPGSLLCHIGKTTLTPVAGWNTISLSGKGCPTLSANTRYWIGYVTGSNNIQQGTVSGSCPGTSLVSVYANTQQGSALLPNPLGATSATPSCYSMSMALNAITVVPTISTLSPTSGAAGTAVTITGTNFGSTQGTSTITFNGTAATPTSWSATSIATTVPAGATTGNVVVTVGGVASNGVSFTVTLSPPSISTLSPTSGASGTAVTITGANFGSTQGASTVTFNGTPATPTIWSATSIATTVPVGATTGNVVVTVGGVASNGVSFTVTLSPPSISTLSPTSGAAGTAVTIVGTNFGSTQGASTVTFNGTAATATSWSATSIATTVPVGATTGNVVVTEIGRAHV